MIRKIDLMQRLFGLSPKPENVCGNCSNLLKYEYQKRYYKCRCYGNTHSEASDWKLNQRGCGMYNMEYDGEEVMSLVRSNHGEAIQGQVALFEYMGEEKNDD